MNILKNTTRTVLAVLLATSASVVLAAGSHSGSHGHGHHGKKGAHSAFGTPGKAANVTRTIEVVMHDNFYEPRSIKVHAGETVRFVVKNAGVLVHEFNIANRDMHSAHQKEMLTMMQNGVLLPTRIDHSKMHAAGGTGMKHDDPNSVLLEPKHNGEIIWMFGDAKNLEFACNVPGHYAAGMVGRIAIN